MQFTNNAAWNYTGPAVTGSAGDQWNHLSSYFGNNVAVTSSAGNATGVTLTWTSDGFTNGSTTGFAGTQYENLMKREIYNNGTISPRFTTATFSGLLANSAFSLYVYTQGDNSGATNGRTLTGSVNGGTSVTTAGAVHGASTFILNQNYLLFTGTADALGKVALSWGGSGEVDLNALQLDTVPEPGTLALLTLSLGVLGAMGRARRQRLGGAAES